MPVSTQFQLPLIALQTDNGREFDNQALRDHLLVMALLFAFLVHTHHRKTASLKESSALSMTAFAVCSSMSECRLITGLRHLTQPRIS
jgi:hypothetical protein